ncbi:6-pyruvoyl-tetrahydropterin synthase-related protein [Sphingobium phenoxybenzoativorans]|uniref:6-pyruvoyl-tetrahydropterin synthase-related protein n=1 Tax=Sphingobium phenoxybenzoativorans TaxID=1592790 RepID=UPI0008722594|nr:6-pyruvoyl-tetrahydropterin synthase-related protein [Sphingobium phenoxybenzoativorans]
MNRGVIPHYGPRHWPHYGLLTLVALVVMLPSFLYGPGATHSVSFNYIWTSQFGAAMQQGDLYPRWLPDSFEGLGSPAFFFYPPLAYWLTGGLDALGLSTLQAINMGAFLLLAASGIAMHLWLTHRGTHPLVGSLIYMLLPYHQLDFWVRGALAEFAAFVWIPLIALAIDRLPHRRGVLLLALSYAGLLITHLPTAMLAGFFLITPLVAVRAWPDRAILLSAASAGALAIALAGFYLVPALTLQDAISSQMLWTPGYQPAAWTIWTLSPGLMPCIALALAILAWPTRSVWAVIVVAGGMAALNLIFFLWDIPPLGRAQFPWRLLGIVEFAAVTALMTYYPSIVRAGIAAALLIPPYIYVTGVAIANMDRPVDYAKMARQMPDAAEYLPVGFDRALIGEGRIANLSQYRDLPKGPEIEVKQAGSVSLHRAAFPIWRVTRDGREVPSTGPVITFAAQPGLYRVERVMIWQEAAGALCTLAAALLALLAGLGRLPGLPARRRHPLTPATA